MGAVHLDMVQMPLTATDA